MRKNRELIALVVAFIAFSLLLGPGSGGDFVTATIYLAPAVLVLYVGKYLWNDKYIFKRPVLGFSGWDLGYVFFSSVVLKVIISFSLNDFLQNIIGIRPVELIVVSLEMLSFAALIALLARLTLKFLPK